MTLNIILISLCCVLCILCVVLGWKLYQFSLVIVSIEDAIEESLDILDVKYGKMNEILKKPIFFDSVEVRQVIQDIKEGHNAILYIANRLTTDIGIKSGEVQEKDSQEKD